MSRTILIVDDHAINREFLSTLLGYSGFRTVEASNGRAALEIARNEGPALIISDVLMPMMDGIELANLLHADPQTSQIPIIFYTATYRLTEARALAQTCGVPFVLSKPAEPTLILGTVAKALNIEIAVPDSHQAAPVNAFLSDASSASALPELAKIQRRLRQAFQPGDAEDPCGLEVTPIPIQPDAQTLSLKLAALLELSLVLTSEYDAAQLLRLFCRAAQDIMNAKCAAIGMWRGDQSIQFASHGMDADEEHLIAGAFQKVGLGLTGNFQSRRTLHCENFKLENNADPHSSIPLSRQDCLMIPIMLGQQMCGWLYLGDKLGTGVFNEDDEQFGLTLVAQLAPVYENLALYDEVREYAGRLELEGIERQRAMVQLQESKELFQQLAENIREVFFLADPHNGHVFYVSPAYESIWGRTCGSLYEHPDSWQEAIHPEDAARIHRLKAGQDKGNEYDLSYRILHPDGSVRFIHERGYPISDAGGALVRIAGIAEDISDEMRTQALLVDREAGLRHAQLLARLAHIISRPDGSFESWSDSLPQLIGVSDGGVPSGFRKWLDIVHQADREAFSHACIEAGRSGSRTEVEYRVWRSDGCLIDVHQVMEPLPEFTNPEGRHRWFNTIQDVSEQTIQRKRIARLNRINGVLSAINSAIVRIHDRDMLFREACRIAVKEGAFSMAWLGIIDPATGHGNVVAWAGEGSEFQRNTRLTARPGMVDSSQPASIALREHRPVVCNRIDQDLSLGPLRGELLAGGHRALATLPLTVDDQAVGVIALFADVTDFFDEQEMRLLNELAGDLSFALQFIGNREQLSYQAFYDALTKIPNDRLFRDRLHQLLQANPPGQHVAIILLNLNRFSQLNDALGRHVGDELLKQVAGRLTDSVHELCSVARISGDTFAIATPQLLQGSDSAVILQHQILYAFEKPFSAGGSVVRLSARAGLALCPEDGADVNTLIHRAEIALKKAKSSGRAYLYYAAEMNTAIATRIMLENELRSAILGKQLEMHYQPRVDLMSGQIVGAEALIRWRHPQRGMIPPVNLHSRCRGKRFDHRDRQLGH